MNIPHLIAHYSYPKYRQQGNVFVVSEFDFHSIALLKKECAAMSYSFLTPNEISTAFDVFPIHFFHIIHFATLVSGTHVFAEKKINSAHLRTAVEYEVRNKMIQLRGDSIAHDPQKIIENIIPTLYPLFAPIAFLFSQQYFTDPQEALLSIDAHISDLSMIMLSLLKKEYTSKNQSDILREVQKWLASISHALEHVVL